MLNKNGKPRRKDLETDESYNRRVWFVTNYLKNIGRGNGKGQNAIRLANIWVNMLLLHCRYPEKLEEIIYSVVKKMEMNK